MPNKPALFLALALAACAHQPPPAFQPKTIRSTVLMSTNKAGTQIVSVNGDTIAVDTSSMTGARTEDAQSDPLGPDGRRCRSRRPARLL